MGTESSLPSVGFRPISRKRCFAITINRIVPFVSQGNKQEQMLFLGSASVIIPDVSLGLFRPKCCRADLYCFSLQKLLLTKVVNDVFLGLFRDAWSTAQVIVLVAMLCRTLDIVSSTPNVLDFLCYSKMIHFITSLNVFDNTVECDSNIYLHECPYMFRLKYYHPQKAQ
jgi:hypothetical protein